MQEATAVEVGWAGLERPGNMQEVGVEWWWWWQGLGLVCLVTGCYAAAGVLCVAATATEVTRRCQAAVARRCAACLA